MPRSLGTRTAGASRCLRAGLREGTKTETQVVKCHYFKKPRLAPNHFTLLR